MQAHNGHKVIFLFSTAVHRLGKLPVALFPFRSQHKVPQEERSMSLTIHAVQSYVRTKKGRIGHADIRECQTAESAKRAAQRMVESGRVLGAMAFSKSLDSATGQLDVLRIIGSYGTVCEPEDELPF